MIFFFLAPLILYWRGIRITYLGLKLCVVFLRVACSGNIVLVQSLFLSRGQVNKMLSSSVTWLNGIVTTTWASLGFGTLPFPPSPIYWTTLMMQNQHGICWLKDNSLLMDPWNISYWFNCINLGKNQGNLSMTTMISFASLGTKLTFMIQHGHAQRMLSNMLLLEMNLISMNSWCHFTRIMSPSEVSFLIAILLPLLILL